MVIATLNCPREAADMASITTASDSARSVSERTEKLMCIAVFLLPVILRLPGIAMLLRVARMEGPDHASWRCQYSGAPYILPSTGIFSRRR